MDRASMIVTFRGMIAQNPIDIGFIPRAQTSVTQTIQGCEESIRIAEKILVNGTQGHASRFVWTVKDDWTVLPAKWDKLQIGGVIYRIIDFVDNYMGAVRRYDLGNEFENGPE